MINYIHWENVQNNANVKLRHGSKNVLNFTIGNVQIRSSVELQIINFLNVFSYLSAIGVDIYDELATINLHLIYFGSEKQH